MEENEKIRQSEFKKSPKFRKLFKFLKTEYVEFQMNQYSTNSLFDLQVFMHILFFFSIIKTVLSLFYFFFIEKIFINTSIILILIQLIISLILTKQNIIYSKFQKQELSLLEIGMKYMYGFFFCFEESMSIYYYNNVNFDLNPVFIYFIVTLILFFDVKNMKRFNETLVGLYIFNLFLLVFFFSVKNLMNFFLPINLVIFIFALINIISQNFSKKIITMQVIHSFLEDVIEKLCKIAEFSIVYQSKCLYNNSCNLNEENKNENEYNFEYLNSEMSDSSCYSKISNSPKNNFELISVNEKRFKGLDIVIKRNLEALSSSRLNHNLPSKNFNNFGLNICLLFDNLLSDKDNNMFEQEEINILANYFRKYFKNNLIKDLFDKNCESLTTSEKLKFIIIMSYFDSYISKNKDKDLTGLEYCSNNKRINLNVNSMLFQKLKRVFETINLNFKTFTIEGTNKYLKLSVFIAKTKPDNTNKNNVLNLQNNRHLDICSVSSFSNLSKIYEDQNEIKSAVNNISQNNIDDEMIEDEINLNECLKNNRLVIGNNDSSKSNINKEFTFKKEVKSIDDTKRRDKNQVIENSKKLPYRIKTKTENNYEIENKILCQHPNLIIFSTSEQPQYLKIIDLQLQGKGFKYIHYNDLENLEERLLDHLINSIDCFSKYCSKSLIIELSEPRSKISEIIEKVIDFEKSHKKNLKKILLRWDKIENDNFNNKFDYIFRLPFIFPDIKTISDSIEMDI